MNINFKEGFRRFTLTICLFTTLIGVILTYSESISTVTTKARNNIAFYDAKKDITYSFKEVAPNAYFYNYNLLKGDGTIQINAYDISKLSNFELNYDVKMNLKKVPKEDLPETLNELPAETFEQNLDSINLSSFAKINNLKIIHNKWYEYLPIIITTVAKYLFTILLLDLFIYGLFLLFAWIFSGFTKTR